jgi:hypothetical protein
VTGLARTVVVAVARTIAGAVARTIAGAVRFGLSAAVGSAIRLSLIFVVFVLPLGATVRAAGCSNSRANVSRNADVTCAA